MNLLIDGPFEPKHYTDSVLAFMQVRAENPNQELGNGGAIPLTFQNTDYLVVRNEDSYTVRVGDTGEEELDAIGIPT